MRRSFAAIHASLLLLTFMSCAERSSEQDAERARFKTISSNYDPNEISEVVEVRGEIANIGRDAAIPRCFLTDRNLGEVQPALDDSVPPGARIPIVGTVTFVLPFFDYECNGDCGDLECYPQDDVPEDVQELLDRIEGIPEPGSRVTVPEVDGLTLDAVSVELALLGLKTCFVTENGCEVFLAGLQPTSGPEVTLDPPPGSEAVSGDVIRLTAKDGTDIFE